MILLLGSVVFSSILTFIFKLFPRYSIDTFVAIVYNYLVCFLCGRFFMGAIPITETLDKAWLPYSLTLSFFFISGFWFVASTVQRFGIGMATLMQKMSLVLSVLYTMIFFGESKHPLKLTGLITAISSIALYNHTAFRSRSISSDLAWLPLLTWLTSGIIEILLFLAQTTGKINGQDSSFVSMIFFGAGILGLLFYLLKNGFGNLTKAHNLVAGVVLGVPNFFSMYFLVKLLNVGWEGSIVFPINNIGILLLSSIGALIVFNEEMGKLRWLALLLAVLSIGLLTAFT